jgi:hypothetical protein
VCTRGKLFAPRVAHHIAQGHACGTERALTGRVNLQSRRRHITSFLQVHDLS